MITLTQTSKICPDSILFHHKNLKESYYYCEITSIIKRYLHCKANFTIRLLLSHIFNHNYQFITHRTRLFTRAKRKGYVKYCCSSNARHRLDLGCDRIQDTTHIAVLSDLGCLNVTEAGYVTNTRSLTICIYLYISKGHLVVKCENHKCMTTIKKCKNGTHAKFVLWNVDDTRFMKIGFLH